MPDRRKHETNAPRLASRYVGGYGSISAIIKTIEGTYQASEKAARARCSLTGRRGRLVGLLVAHVHNIHRLSGRSRCGNFLTLAPWLVPALLASGITLSLMIGASGTGEGEIGTVVWMIGSGSSRGGGGWRFFGGGGGSAVEEAI